MNDAANGGSVYAPSDQISSDSRYLPGGEPWDAGAIDEALLLAAHRTSLYELSQRFALANESISALSTGIEGRRGTLTAIAKATIPRWHFPMLNDSERNDAFAVALERRVRPGSHVLDIGSGTGLLAMMAIQAGAGRVTTCEANPLMAEIATQVIAAHGMADVVTVLPLHSTDVRVGHELPSPADLIISEIVDCGLIGEGLLPTMRHARRELLAPGGALLPRAARIMGFLVESDALTRLNRVHFAGTFDVRLLNCVSTLGHFPVRLNTWPHHALSDGVELVNFDLATDSLEDGSKRIRFDTRASGRVDGVVAWFELDLGADVVIRNSADNLASHWMQAFVPFDEPLCVEGSDRLDVDLSWRDGRLFAEPKPMTLGGD